MTGASEFPRSFGDDPQLQAAVEEYEAALVAGGTADRDRILAAHPAQAERLAEAFDALEQLHGVLPAIRAPQGADDACPAPPEAIADFRILRELGRGGMGIVYEAEERALGRRVALKVLPFAAALDPRSLARFRQESLAAAQLDHPHIVRVYGVGSDRGVHYYAMQYIDGQSLAQIIAAMRSRETTPAGAALVAETVAGSAADLSTERTTNRPAYCRAVARLGAQVALALDYAHGQGILHRDIKPGNLLLDDRGNVWVTDFGLARVENEANLTLTGDVLGTLRYMSPEQAHARRGLVDQRTDIYSLGATLYELLTLEPVFSTAERGELLRQIALDDPRPLRQIDRSIPVEIETIVMKSLEKDPGDRYATAHDLALDLQRFLDDQPLAARPATAMERLIKWSRRHRPLVASLAVSLVLSLLGLVVVAVLYGWNQRQIAADRAQLALDEENRQKQMAIDLHAARLGKSEAVQIARGPNYREEVWQILKEAVAQEVPDKHLETVKRQALDCLGDPFGLGPVSLTAQARRPAPGVPESFQKALGDFRRFNIRPVWSAADDGSRLVLAGSGIRGLEILDENLNRRSLAAPLGPVHAVAFGPSGRFLAAACEEGLIVWTVPEFEVELKVRGDVIRTLAFQPAGQLIALMNRERRLELWSLASHRPVHSLTAPEETTAVEFSGDGDYLLALAGDRVAAAYSITATPEKRFLYGHTGAVTGVEFSPDGRSLVSVSKDRTVRIWDAATGKVRLTLGGHRSEVQDAAFSPDGKFVATADWAGSIRLWDPATGHMAARIDATENPGQVWRLRFEPHGSYLAAAGRRGLAGWSLSQPPDGVVPMPLFAVKSSAFTDPATGRVEIGQPPTLFDLAIHPAGRDLVVLDGRGRIFGWRFSEGGPPRLLAQGGGIHFPTLTFDSSGAALTYVTTQNAVALWDWQRESAARVTAQKFTGTSVVRLARTADGRQLAVAAPASQIVVYDLESDRELVRLPRETAEVWTLSWSPEGTRLAIGLSDGSVAIWDIAQVASALRELGIRLSPLAAGGAATLPPLALDDDAISRALAATAGRCVTDLRTELQRSLRTMNISAVDGLSFRLVQLAGRWRAAGGPPHEVRVELIDLLNEVGFQFANFRLDRHAERLFRAAISLEQAAPGAATGDPAARVRRARSFLGLGASYELRRQTFEAAELYRRGLEMLGTANDDEPQNPALQFARLGVSFDLGRTLVATGRAAEAERILKEAIAGWDKFAQGAAIEPPPARIQADVLLADLYARAGRATEAEDQLRSLLARHPQSTEGQYRLAWLLANAADRARRRPAEAVRWAQKIVQAAPANGPYWRALGAAHYRAGEWEPAQRALEAARGINRDKDFGLDGFLLALCEWQRKNEDRARKWLAASRRWMDRFAAGDVLLGRLRDEASALIAPTGPVPSASDERPDDLDETISLYTVILDADPQACWALVERAKCLRERGRSAEARADLQKAAGLPGAARDDWRALANEFRQAENWTDAIAALQRLVVLDPQNYEALNELAWNLAICPAVELRDPDRAARLATQALVRDPFNGGFANTLGVAQYRRGDWEAARGALASSLNLLGDRAFAHNGYFLALVADRLGDRELARKWHAAAAAWAGRFADDDPESIQFAREAAEALGAAEYPPALSRERLIPDPEIYSLIDAVLPRTPWVLCRRAECFAALGEREKARHDVLAALEAGGTDLNSGWRILSLAARLEDWETAIDATRDLSTDRPDHQTLIAFRVRGRLERQEWDQALDDLAAMADLVPDDDGLVVCQAAIFLAANHREAYRQALANLAARAQNALMPGDAIPLLEALLADPPEQPESAQLVLLAQRATSSGPEAIRTLGAALYRNREFAAAIEAFEKSAGVARLRASDHLFLAMAHARLNHLSEAQAELDLAGDPLSPTGVFEMGNTDAVLAGWHSRIALAHLRREAEAVIKEQVPRE
jgi:serine/threonine protein kinase/WD40 repeat protein/uncharacterized protein HemY